MSKLSEFKNCDLQALMAEIEVELSASDSILKIIRKIEKSSGYDREVVQNQIKIIAQDRLDKLALEKKQRDLAERERQYELGKIKATEEADAISLNLGQGNESLSKNVMQKFDPEKSDMSLF